MDKAPTQAQAHFMTIDGGVGPRVDDVMRMLDRVAWFHEEVRAGRKTIKPISVRPAKKIKKKATQQ